MGCRTPLVGKLHAESAFSAKTQCNFTLDMFRFSPHQRQLARWTQIFLGLLGLTMMGCNQDRGDYARFNASASGTELALHTPWKRVLNFEPLPPPSSSNPVLQPLLEDILQLGPWPPKDKKEQLKLDSAWQGFVSFEGSRMAIQGIDSTLSQTGILTASEKTLSDAFGRWSSHFPEAPVPDLALAYTGFNFSVYPTDKLLLIGCEFFIGGDHPSVKGLPPTLYPRYMQERMVPAHLTSDAIRGWLLVHFQDGHYNTQGRLADELLYWGKVLYLARCLAPEIAPHHFMDWTESEWAWAQAHERQVWSELRKEETLYTRRRTDIQRWVVDGPFTKAGSVPQESPDRLGWYMGMRWAEDFMSRNQEVDLPGLMEQNDVLPFLQAYRPGS